MKKSRKIFLLLLAIMLVVTMLPTANVEAASKVKLSKNKITIYVGKSETLKVTGTSKKVTWTSSDKKKATVSSKGKVIAKKAGSVTITAKVGNKKYNCKVTVKNPSLNAKSKTVHVGNTFTLKLSGATVSKWSSSDKNKASVSSAGKVSAKKAGTVTITAADKAGKKYTCKVTVEGHIAGNWEVAKAATCSTEGKEAKKCTECGKEMETRSIAKTNHVSGDWEVAKAATCSTEGKEVKKCTECGKEMETRSIAKTNHVSGDWQVTVQPTENSTGTKVKNCTVCGTQLESASIDKVAHSHNYAWVESGNTRTMKCSCGDSKGVTETNYGGHWGYFDSGMASSLFNEANSARQEAQYTEYDILGNLIYAGNVQAVSRDSSLDSLAERRATEVLSNWSHQGRDIDSYYTTENLAKGFNSVIDVLCAWSASHDHAGTLTYQYYTKAGAAWFWWDADNTGENLVGVAVMEYSE